MTDPIRIAQGKRTLADYRPQHDDGCAKRLCAYCGQPPQGRGHLDHDFVDALLVKSVQCTCGLDDLLAAVQGEQGKETEMFKLFAAGFTAAREQESLISADGPWYPKYRTAADAWDDLAAVQGSSSLRQEEDSSANVGRTPEWREGAFAGQPVDASGQPWCLDCRLPYEQFPLDLLLPRAQWLEIHPGENGLLCAQCMVKRAAKIPGATVVHAVIEIAPHQPKERA